MQKKRLIRAVKIEDKKKKKKKKKKKEKKKKESINIVVIQLPTFNDYWEAMASETEAYFHRLYATSFHDVYEYH